MSEQVRRKELVVCAHVSDHTLDVIEELIAQGWFANRAEVVREALRYYIHHEGIRLLSGVGEEDGE